MLKHILMTWDGSTAGEHLLAHTVSMAKLADAKLTLLHVPEQPPVAQLSEGVDPMAWHLAEAETEAELDKVVNRLLAERLTVQKAILESARPEYLIRYAHEHGIDLIVVANQDDNISTSLHNMLAATDIPLLIIRPKATSPAAETIRYQKLMIPLDGSMRAECAMPLATYLAHIANSELLLAHVVRKPEIPHRAPPTPEDTELAKRVIERNRIEADKYLEQLIEKLGQRRTIEGWQNDDLN